MTSPHLRPGEKLASTVSATKVVVIRVPADRRPLLTCGGSPMVPAAAAPPQPPPAANAANAANGGAATVIGKRYIDATETVEVLCVASGAGELSCDGAPMTLKAAKPLPASD
jgi:hypothetical protein